MNTFKLLAGLNVGLNCNGSYFKGTLLLSILLDESLLPFLDI